MLLGDRRAPVRPSLAEVDEIGHDHLGDHGCGAQVGEQAIEHGVRADIIKPRQRLGETRALILDPVPCGDGAVAGAAGTSPAGVESTASAACRAETPAASSACIARTRRSSSAPYRRKPPALRSGCSSP